MAGAGDEGVEERNNNKRANKSRYGARGDPPQAVGGRLCSQRRSRDLWDLVERL